MDNIIFSSIFIFFTITNLGYYQPVSSEYPIDHKMGENLRFFFFFLGKNFRLSCFSYFTLLPKPYVRGMNTLY